MDRSFELLLEKEEKHLALRRYYDRFYTTLCIDRAIIIVPFGQ